MLVQLIGSIIAVLAIASLVWYLGLGKAVLADDAQARRMVNDMLSGFDADDVILSKDNQAALIFGKDGSFAILKRHGAKFAARRLKLPAQIIHGDGFIEIDSGEFAYGKISINLSETEAKRLADRLLTSV